MKIVQVQTQAEAAGAQRVSDMVGEGLRRRGHDVRTVFMYRKTDAYDGDTSADFAFGEIPRGPIDRLRAVLALIGYVRRERPDAVLTYQHFGNVFGTIAGRLAGVKRLVANQSGVPLTGGARGVATWLDKLMGTLGFYDYSIVNSGWTAEQFEKYPAPYRERMRRIDHGVPGSSGAYEKRAARRTFELPANATIIVSSGRLSDTKRHVTLVRALRSLPANVHLAIAGQGPEYEALEAEAEALQVSWRVHLVGEVPPAQIFEFLAAGDVYATASVEETFGLAVVEAAIAGLPIVATRLPVLREVLSTPTASAAVFVEPDDAEGFAAAITTVLEDYVLAARLRTTGRSLADRYSPDRMCAAYEELLAD
jgi:glycosyltransferase involved in cell wall biosynthesis